MKCSNCNGRGTVFLWNDYGEQCYLCIGTGKITRSKKNKWIKEHKNRKRGRK